MAQRKTNAQLEKEIAEEEKRLTAEQEGQTSETQQEVLEAETEENQHEKIVETAPEKVDKTPDQGEDKTDWKKRYGDLRRSSQEQLETVRKEVQELKDRLADTNVRPLASNESVDEWKQKFPDIALIVETVADKIAQDKFDQANLSLTELNKKQEKIDKAEMVRDVKKTHKDYDKIVDSDAFQEWTDEQPAWVRDVMFNGKHDVKSVTQAITLYKADMGILSKAETEKAKEEEKEVAKAVEAKSSKPDVREDTGQYKFSESQVERETRKDLNWFAKNQDAIMEAQRKGQFLYDLSAGAR